LRLRKLYKDLRFNHANRIRKSGVELKKDGTPAKNPQRVGPLTMDARRLGLATVLTIQAEINPAAVELGRPTIDILNVEEWSRIEELIEANTWPDNWTGDEVPGDALLDKIFNDGTTQPLLEVLA
jgi:DNA sulfur modification protein DndC